jgi:hypothetical protein
MERLSNIVRFTCEGCKETFQRPRNTYLNMVPNEAKCCDTCIEKNKLRQTKELFRDAFQDYNEEISLTTDPEKKKKLQEEKRRVLQAICRQHTEK